jgi:MFS family permease
MPRLKKIFWETTWANKNLGSVTQAGLINNLNDALTWGLFPILLASKGFSIAEIGIITAIYPAVWGIGQLFTGKMADHYCKKDLLFGGNAIAGPGIDCLAVCIHHGPFYRAFLHSWLGNGDGVPDFSGNGSRAYPSCRQGRQHWRIPPMA